MAARAKFLLFDACFFVRVPVEVVYQRGCKHQIASQIFNIKTMVGACLKSRGLMFESCL